MNLWIRLLNGAKKPLSPDAFEIAATETEALMLDTRDPEDFARGFVPNSINISLDGNFAQWVGEMIADVTQEILLITYPGKEEETITRLSRVGYDHAIGYLKGGFEAWKKANKKTDRVQRLSIKEFEKEYNSNISLVFDVRKKSEFNSEHILGAINIPLNDLNAHLSQIPKNKPFILYCEGGYRSMIAASILKQGGWENFKDVTEGFEKMVSTRIPRSEYVCPTTLL